MLRAFLCLGDFIDKGENAAVEIFAKFFDLFYCFVQEAGNALNVILGVF